MRWMTGLLFGVLSSAAVGNPGVSSAGTTQESLASSQTSDADGRAISDEVVLGGITNSFDDSWLHLDLNHSREGLPISGITGEDAIGILTRDELRYETAESIYSPYSLMTPDDESQPTGSLDLRGFPRGDLKGEGALGSNDLVVLSRSYDNSSASDATGNAVGNARFNDLLTPARQYGEYVPPESGSADVGFVAPEPVALVGGLAQWIGGIVLVIVIIATGIAVGVGGRRSGGKAS